VRILLVEDDSGLADAVVQALVRHGHTTAHVIRGAVASFPDHVT
jgi:DNA-binding response OmpR family regulator